MAKSCPAAPAIPLAELWGSILQNCLDEISLFALQQNAELRELQFRAHQIVYLVNWAPPEPRTEISIGSLMRTLIAPILRFTLLWHMD
jgi:hypothetical protein